MSPSAMVIPHVATPPTHKTVAEQYRAAVAPFPICLVTGGAGYIGSHTVLELITAGFAVVVIDNLCNSHMESLCRVHYIARMEFERCGEGARQVPPIFFHKVDIRDAKSINDVFAFWQDENTQLDAKSLPIDIGASAGKKVYPMLDYNIDPDKRSKVTVLAEKPSTHGKIGSVIHFAALKAVGESLSRPLDYYDTNITGLLTLLKAVHAANINVFVFSSSAVVYGKGHEAGITEETVQVAGRGSGGGLLTNPYGRSKWMSEEILNDYCVSNPGFHATALRYFNPTGSHPSGLIGEDPKGIPNNIVPVILQAYERRRSRVHVFGSSYDTADGTGVRDYIHVSDLAKGHLAAIRKAIAVPEEPTLEIQTSGHDPASNYNVYNLGTGRGYSVLEIIKAFSTAAGTEIPFVMGDARAGDLGTVTASADKAATELDWRAEFDIQDMCRDVFNWAAANPGGYEKLRRLSTISGRNPTDNLRKASIASGLFDNDDEFDNFMTSTVANFARRQSTAARRTSVASLTVALAKSRQVSVSSNTSLEEQKAHMSQPPSPNMVSKTPSFNLSWSDNQRRSQHVELQPMIEVEEEELGSPTDDRMHKGISMISAA